MKDNVKSSKPEYLIIMGRETVQKPYIFPEREIIDRMVGWYHGNVSAYRSIKTVTETRRYREGSNLHDVALEFIDAFFGEDVKEIKLQNEKNGYFQHLILGKMDGNDLLFTIETTHSNVNTPRVFACTMTIGSKSIEISRQALKYAAKVLQNLTDDLEPEKPEGLKISLMNWDQNRGGIADNRYTLEEVPWEKIRLNYNEEVRTGIETALAFTPDTMPRGKLMMWYGVPGTGKSWCIKSLAQAWADWADFNYVIDPEYLFHSAAYLNQAFLVDHKKDGKPRWRVLVLEDCEKYFTAGKGTVTDDFSRVLNVTDGVMAELSRTIILSTSNTKLSDFHDAITRPGRCLHQLEFTEHNTDSSNKWLRRHGVETTVANSQSLAELYGIFNDYKPQQNVEKVLHTGSYL